MITEEDLDKREEFLRQMLPGEIHNGRYFTVIDYDAIEKETYKPLNQLICRLKKIGIELLISANVPWYYLDAVNGNRVKERFQSEHGFVLFVSSCRLSFDNIKIKFSDIRKIFEVIRRYRYDGTD